MGKIQVLSDTLASQVAAGEVVERPASVVKELVDNSIDAGASRIDVLIRRGGVALIRVTDDGCGMSREDAKLCLERHATSKIRTSEDLGAITTMGFRGEAMPSIASVSRFTLHTRETGALCGTEVQVEGGTLTSVADSGEAPGTSVEVRQLFYNIPARRKFLRSEDTEFSHIEQQVRLQALAHPEVSFSLTRDDRLLFHLPGGGGLLERIRGLTGPEITDRLLEIPRQVRGPLTVSGYIGEAGLARANRGLQFTILNSRPVEAAAIQYALRGGYGEAMPRGQHPVVFLFIEIDHAEVDVNVHPAKKEVRFRDGNGVQQALQTVIAETLRRGRRAALPAADPEPPEPAHDALPQRPAPAPPADLPRRTWTPAPVQPQLIPEREQHALRQDWSDIPPAPPPPAAPPQESPPSTQPPLPAPPSTLPQPAAAPMPATERGSNASPFRFLAFLAAEYIVLESPEGLVLLDHRAARERILFEDARDRRSQEPVAAQKLLTPLTVQLSPREFDALRPHLAALRRMGVGAEEFGGTTLLIDSLPPWHHADGDAHALIVRLLEDLRAAGDRAPARRLDDDAIAAVVARQAARQTPPDSPAAAAALVSRLMACGMPYCCPEGRPTMIQLSHQELARKFGRR